MNQASPINQDRFPLTVRRARVKAGTFYGCEKHDVASVLDIADGQFVSSALSQQEPGVIFGLFARET